MNNSFIIRQAKVDFMGCIRAGKTLVCADCPKKQQLKCSVIATLDEGYTDGAPA